MDQASRPGTTERGIRVLDEVADRGWGDRDGAVADPDGNTIYLRSRPAQ
jgi:uncharacterized glyoxalase superfamily protein PhnB